MPFALHSTAADQQTVAPSRKAAPLPDTVAGSGYRGYLCLLLFLAFGLRLVMLDRFRFHQDEALYSYWALNFLHDDPNFLTQWIDKPPLFIWLLASSFQAFGASEAGARLLNIGISTLTVPVVAAVARHTWTANAGLIAAAVYTLNPFAISYSPTAFTDPLFVLGGLSSVYAAQKRSPLWAGLCLGGAIMAKQQGVFFIPLTLAVLFAGNLNARALVAALLRLGGGLALTILPVLYWDTLRWTVAPSPWDLGIRNFGVLEIVAPAQWAGRVARIGELLWYLAANQFVWIILALVVALALLHGRLAGHASPRRTTVFAILLCCWIGAYWAIHAVTSLPLWDRYFLPLAPFFAILVGGISARTVAAASTRWKQVLLGLWILLMLPSALQASRGEIPIGSDHGAYDGLRAAFVWLDNNSRDGSVLYHQALSWHLRFYFYENPHRYTVRWFASPIALADDAAKMATRSRFVIVPTWLPLRNRYPHLAARGLELIHRHRVEQFTIYELK